MRSFGDRVEVLVVSVSLSPSFGSHPTLGIKLVIRWSSASYLLFPVSYHPISASPSSFFKFKTYCREDRAILRSNAGLEPIIARRGGAVAHRGGGLKNHRFVVWQRKAHGELVIRRVANKCPRRTITSWCAKKHTTNDYFTLCPIKSTWRIIRHMAKSGFLVVHVIFYLMSYACHLSSIENHCIING
jgi:hypothetical protein